MILGGNAGISRLMTSLMIERSWSVVSVVRDARQSTRIRALGNGQKGTVEVIAYDLSDVKSVHDAQSLLVRAKPSVVVFAAGKRILLSSCSPLCEVQAI